MRLRVRALLRRSIGATVFLSVLVGVAGALVLTGVVGARRARTTYDELLARNQPADAVVVFCEASCDLEEGVDPTRYATPEDLAFLATLPGVTATSESTCLLGRLVLEGHAATARDIGVGCLSLRPVPESLELHPVVVEGRAFDPGADEVVVDEEQAARSGLAVGDQVQITAFTADQFAALSSGDRTTPPAGSGAAAEIVGVVRQPEDLIPAALDQDAELLGHGMVFLSPGLWSKLGPDVARFGVITELRLADGDGGVDEVAAALEAALRRPRHGGRGRRLGRLHPRGHRWSDPAGDLAGVGCAVRLRRTGRRRGAAGGRPGPGPPDRHGVGRRPGPASDGHDHLPDHLGGGAQDGARRRRRCRHRCRVGRRRVAPGTDRGGPPSGLRQRVPRRRPGAARGRAPRGRRRARTDVAGCSGPPETPAGPGPAGAGHRPARRARRTAHGPDRGSLRSPTRGVTRLGAHADRHHRRPGRRGVERRGDRPRHQLGRAGGRAPTSRRDVGRRRRQLVPDRGHRAPRRRPARAARCRGRRGHGRGAGPGR